MFYRKSRKAFSCHIKKGKLKKRKESEKKKKNDDSLEITGSFSLKTTRSEGNTECLCLPVLQSHFLSI